MWGNVGLRGDTVDGITTENMHSGVDFGNPVGRESLEVAGRYVPDAGDIAWLRVSPQADHEQAGHHPALVVSPKQLTTVGRILRFATR